MAVKDAEHQLNLEISENEARKDFSKAERIDYARRLERIESLKAEKRMKTGKVPPMEIFPQGTTRDIVASNLRQRVLGNTNPVKLGRCFDFLNNYYGFIQGGNHGNQYTVANEKTFNLPNSPSTQKEFAESYGITQQTMNNYMRMASMIPELEDLVDEKSKLCALISNNFGRRNNNPAKDRKVLETYVSLRGYKQGELGRNHFQT